MKLAAVGAWYVAAQLAAVLILPALSSWVFGDLLPRLWAALSR